MDQYTWEKLLKSGVPQDRLQHRNLAECQLAHFDLTGCDLRGFIITKTNLEHAEMMGADLRGLQFAATNCVSARFSGADLRGANLAFGYFHGADFRGADLRGARIANALCSQANFSGADLRGAHLGREHYDSDFLGSDLRGVFLPEGADFETLNCDVTGAQLTPRGTERKSNKRRHERVRLSPSMKVYDRKTLELLGTLVDISAEGMKLSCGKAISVNTVFQAQMLLPEGNPHGQSVRVTAKCVWCRQAPGSKRFWAGCQVKPESPQDGQIIQMLIKEYNTSMEVPLGIEIGTAEKGISDGPDNA
jgi:uncharacterized protein YjbI with pentapeptide repeats